jgi:hypothetical protein
MISRREIRVNKISDPGEWVDQHERDKKDDRRQLNPLFSRIVLWPQKIEKKSEARYRYQNDNYPEYLDVTNSGCIPHNIFVSLQPVNTRYCTFPGKRRQLANRERPPPK